VRAVLLNTTICPCATVSECVGPMLVVYWEFVLPKDGSCSYPTAPTAAQNAALGLP
jgi:hypothetical protein